MIFKKQAEEDFNIQAAEFPEMESLINRCANIYGGAPEWLDDKNNIKTINFAKSVCSETARLATLAIGIQIDGSARATWLQEQIDKVYFQIRHWVEYGCAYGTVFIKPNGESIDVFTPADVMIVDYDNQEIKGIIFKDSYTVGRKYYTRLEYHRFVETTVDGVTTYPYYVSNRAYVSKSPQSIGDKIDLKQTKWADLMADTPPILKANGEKLDGPLYGVLRTPQANNVDINAPLGLPIFAEAIEELKDLDIAYSRNAGENNYTKYWRDIKPDYQGQPWCAAFVSWCMMKAFGLDTAKKLLKHWPYVYCPTMADLFTLNSNPKVGDIVIFYRNGTFTHTGIVIKVSGDRFWTVEGNTSSGSAIIANGGGVCQKSYYNSNLPGTKFCTPNYNLVKNATPVSDTAKKQNTRAYIAQIKKDTKCYTKSNKNSPSKMFPKLKKGAVVEVMKYTETDSSGLKWYFIRIPHPTEGFVFEFVPKGTFTRITGISK